MKKLLVMLAAGLALAGYSQTTVVSSQTNVVAYVTNVIKVEGLTLSSLPVLDTNNVPTQPYNLLDFLTMGSNWWAAPFGTYSVRDHTMGGGLALGYRVAEVFSPMVRLDYFAGKIWVPSLTAQLSVPRTLMGKIPVIPFAIGGVATTMGNNGLDNGQLVGIVGAGAAIRLDWVGKGTFWQKSDIVADYENWQGLPSNQQLQVRFGFLYKF